MASFCLSSSMWHCDFLRSLSCISISSRNVVCAVAGAHHTPSTTTLNAWFCQAFPSLGGSGVLLWLHTIPFVCVRLLLQVYLVVSKLSLPLSIDIDRYSTQQLATRRFTPVIEAYDMLWIYQYVRSGSVKAMAYQRSISEVPSSGCLKNPARREC